MRNFFSILLIFGFLVSCVGFILGVILVINMMGG